MTSCFFRDAYTRPILQCVELLLLNTAASFENWTKADCRKNRICTLLLQWTVVAASKNQSPQLFCCSYSRLLYFQEVLSPFITEENADSRSFRLRENKTQVYINAKLLTGSKFYLFCDGRRCRYMKYSLEIQLNIHNQKITRSAT